MIKDGTKGQKAAIVAFLLGFGFVALVCEVAPLLSLSVFIATVLGLYFQNR